MGRCPEIKIVIMLKQALLFLMMTAIFTSCFTEKKKKVDTNKNDSIMVVKKPFDNNPKKIEYEISVLKGTNKRHGLQKRYYPHGSIYSEIDYRMNKRVGVAKTYYQAYGKEKAKVWKEQRYEEGKLNGISRRYHKNGQLQAEYEYKKGLPGVGLKEYTNKGVLVKQPKLILKQRTKDGYIEITAQMSNKSRRVKFFTGFLVEGKYWSKNMKPVEVNSKGIGKILIPITTEKRFETVTAMMSTRFSNKLIVSETITF